MQWPPIYVALLWASARNFHPCCMINARFLHHHRQHISATLLSRLQSCTSDVPSQWGKAIFGHLGSVTLKPIFLKFGKNDYVSHAIPCAKSGGRPKRGPPKSGVASGYRQGWHEIHCFAKKTGPLQLIWHDFTNSQRSLSIFDTEIPYSILNSLSVFFICLESSAWYS